MKIPSEILKLLDDAGVQYHLDFGTKHARLMVEGQFVTVLSYGNSTKRRTMLNCTARVKRALREIDKRKGRFAPGLVIPVGTKPAQPEKEPQMNAQHLPVEKPAKTYSTVFADKTPALDMLIDALGYETAAEAIGMTGSALRRNANDGKFRPTTEMAAKTACADLGIGQKSGPETKAAKIVVGDAAEVEALLAQANRFDVRVVELPAL
jgi:hypothetical protein